MNIELSALALKKMISMLDTSKQSSLLSMLPPNQFANVERIPKLGSQERDLSLEELSNKIHPSHFIKSLKALSKKDRRFLISPLSKESQAYLCNHFGDSHMPYQLDPLLQLFVLRLLIDSVFKEEERPIPFSFLPQEQLSFLAAASHAELLLLCSSLGLFDVVIELKKIIHSTTLKKLEASFTFEELSFIQQIQNYHPNPIYQEMGLKNFDGNVTFLREVVFIRGLNRLAVAISNASKFLVQHILLTLSLDESAKLKSLQGGVKDKGASSIFVDQVLFTWDKRCTHSHS